MAHRTVAVDVCEVRPVGGDGDEAEAQLGAHDRLEAVRHAVRVREADVAQLAKALVELRSLGADLRIEPLLELLEGVTAALLNLGWRAVRAVEALLVVRVRLDEAGQQPREERQRRVRTECEPAQPGRACAPVRDDERREAERRGAQRAQVGGEVREDALRDVQHVQHLGRHGHHQGARGVECWQRSSGQGC